MIVLYRYKGFRPHIKVLQRGFSYFSPTLLKEESYPGLADALNKLKDQKITISRHLNPFQTQLLETSLSELGLPIISGLPQAGQRLFPHSHSIYFGACTPEGELNVDGYGKAFAPPAPPFSRRVISSGRLQFNCSNWLQVRQVVSLTTSCNQVLQGFSQSRGNTVSVEQKKVYENTNGISLTEFRTITYFEPQAHMPRARSITTQPPRASSWCFEVLPTPVLLFRYSALTFNAHRIHYDAAYCREVENYPDCLVHGPLTCTLSLRFLTKVLKDEGLDWSSCLQGFDYKLIRPLFVNRPFYIKAKMENDLAHLWIETKEGLLAFKGKAQLK